MFDNIVEVIFFATTNFFEVVDSGGNLSLIDEAMIGAFFGLVGGIIKISVIKDKSLLNKYYKKFSGGLVEVSLLRKVKIRLSRAKTEVFVRRGRLSELITSPLLGAVALLVVSSGTNIKVLIMVSVLFGVAGPIMSSYFSKIKEDEVDKEFKAMLEEGKGLLSEKERRETFKMVNAFESGGFEEKKFYKGKLSWMIRNSERLNFSNK